jgi:hypothetical protein
MNKAPLAGGVAATATTTGGSALTAGACFFTFMGTPSTTKPWGFQHEGHDGAINYFVLDDQVVMTPTFMGSEPTSATCTGEKVTLFKKRGKVISSES